MASTDESRLNSAASADLDSLDDAALESRLRDVPRGALALSALTIGLLLLAWFLVYALVFLPRGMVS